MNAKMSRAISKIFGSANSAFEKTIYGVLITAKRTICSIEAFAGKFRSAIMESAQLLVQRQQIIDSVRLKADFPIE